MDPARAQRRQLTVLARVRQVLDGFYQEQRIEGSYDLRPALEKILELAIGELEFDREKRAERAVVVFRSGEGELEVSAGWSREDVDRGLSRTVIDRILAENRSLVVDDASRDDRFRNAESVRMGEILSCLAAPIRIDGVPVGAVYVDTRKIADAFTEADGAFLSRFADTVAPHLKSALLHRRHLDEIERLRRELTTSHGFSTLIGKSPGMRRVLDLIRRVAADPDVKVLIRGESGTGKELVARAIHDAGSRWKGPFVAVNCAALPRDLLESELFGHEKGAFTGALGRRIGRFEEANHGTLLLDEIGEMSPELQAKLLRVLQDGSFSRVGGTGSIRSDVRVLAATHRDLEALVAAGTFREDLYHRINVLTIEMPPLRERSEDIPLLAAHLLSRCNARRGRNLLGFSPAAEAALRSWPWPGNVRELENVIERAALLTDGPYVDVENLPAPLRSAASGAPEPLRELADQDMTLEEMSRLYARLVLDRHGTKTEACRVLGITDKTLNRLLKNGD